MRSRLYLERLKGDDDEEADSDLRVLKSMKSNYGPIGNEIKLRWKAGAFTPHATGDSFAEMAAQSKAERLFLELLDAYEADGRYVSATPSANYAPAVFAKDPRADGIRAKGFAGAMNLLFAAKAITFASYGPPSKGRKRVART